MKKITKITFATLLVAGSVGLGFGQANQQNIGSKCGCPTVPNRTAQDISTGGGTLSTTNGVNELTGTTHLTCDKLWTFGGKWYFPSGAKLIIDPGTVLQGTYTATIDNAATIVIERGAQIMAAGTEDCPIVMTTSNDNLDGTYSITNVSQWGGLEILGTASNNLWAHANSADGKTNTAYPNGGYPLGTAVSGIGHAEGFFNSRNVANEFGAGDVAFPSFNDHDNSGVITYVSLRHPGAIIGGLSKGNEINGLTFSSVGDGTTVNHVEVVSSGDDDFEYFGGQVNVKYMSSYFGDDDKFDYDLGYKGKAQFIFAIAADSTNSGNLKTSDNGIEADADDQFGSTFQNVAANTSGYTNSGFYQSNPNIWNATMISNGKILAALDNTGHAGIQAKEMAGGQIHNSIFVNFYSGLHLSEVRSNSTLKGDAYDQWTNDGTNPYLIANGGFATKNALVVQDNIFVVPNDHKHFGFTRGALIRNGAGDGGGVGKFMKDWTGTTNNGIAVADSLLHVNQGTINVTTYTTAAHQSASIGLPNAADSVQFLTTDRNQIVNSIPGIKYLGWAFNVANNGFASPYHAIPTTNLTSPSTPPADGFFTVVNFKGAFDANDPKGSWLSSYGLMSLSMQSQQQANPTDLNDDGSTDINDFLIFVNFFNTTDK